MTECPKCGSLRITGPSYMRHRDCLRYYCDKCGYAQDEDTKEIAEIRQRQQRPPTETPR